MEQQHGLMEIIAKILVKTARHWMLPHQFLPVNVLQSVRNKQAQDLKLDL